MSRMTLIHALACATALSMAPHAPDDGSAPAPAAAAPPKGKSIFALLKNGQISLTDALMRAEVWIGQAVERVPGGKGLITLFSDLATGGAKAAAAPITVVAMAIEAPVDAYFAARLGALGPIAQEDFNAAVQAASADLLAFIQLQASNFAANMQAGAAQAAGAAKAGETSGSPS